MKYKLKLIPWTAAWLCWAAALLPQNLSADPLDHWHWRAPEPTTNALLGVAYGSGKFVAVGLAGTIVTSADGTAWTLGLGVSATSAYLRSVTFGGGMFLAVGEGGTILSSSNGVDWTARHSGTTNDLYAAIFGQDLFLTVGANGTITTSIDGVAWDARQPGVLAGSTLTSIAYGQGTLLGATTGFLPGVFGSNDGGTNWWVDTWLSGTAQVPPDLLGLSGVAYGNGRFVAVGAGNSFDFPTGVALTTTNTFDWDRVNTGAGDVDTIAGLWAVAFGRDTFVTVGPVCGFWCSEPPLISSRNGKDWSYHRPRVERSLFAVAYGRGTFVAVGESGTILQSDKIGPRLELLSTAGPDSYLFKLIGDAGETYRIETSIDLANWTALTNFISATGTNEFMDLAAQNFSRRFYRAVTL